MSQDTLREYIGKTLIFEWNNSESKTIFEGFVDGITYRLSGCPYFKIKAKIISAIKVSKRDWSYELGFFDIEKPYIKYELEFLGVEDIQRSVIIDNDNMDNWYKIISARNLFFDLVKEYQKYNLKLYISYKNMPYKIFSSDGKELIEIAI